MLLSFGFVCGLFFIAVKTSILLTKLYSRNLYIDLVQTSTSESMSNKMDYHGLTSASIL